MKEILTIIKGNKRLKIIMVSGISILLLYVIGVAYAAFTNSQNKLAANLKVNDLAYYMTTNDGGENDRILKSKAGKTELFNIYLASLNTIQTKYELIYKVCTNSSCTSYKGMPNGFSVNISETTIDEIRGTINSNGTKLFSIVTINTSSSDVYIEISLNAGYSWNELALSNQITETSEFYQDDLKIISVVDGIEQTNAEFPTTPNYDVNITCTRGGQAIAGFEGSGFWNSTKNKWQFDLIGLQQSGTVCQIEFIYQAITRIAVTTPPNKTVYNIGEAFNTTGMVVTAYTATGSYNVTGYTVSPTTMSSTTTSVTITYTVSGITRTCTQAVRVSKLSDRVIASVGNTGGATNYGTAGYRYSGASPYNYITFNGETWRIIGVVDGSQIGKETGTYYTKIIRNASIGNKAWDGESNTWYTSSLYNTLNNTSAYTGNPNVEAVNWYHSSNASVLTTAQYTAEGWGTTCSTSSSYCTTNTKVGIMSPSDYGYASSACWNAKSLYGYNDASCTGSNWLYINNTLQWLLGLNAPGARGAWIVYYDGYVAVGLAESDVGRANAVRPVVYLIPSTTVTGGNGTSGSPYTIG